MAENSSREKIIVKHIDIVRSIKDIKTFDRGQKGYEDLSNYSAVQFPIAAIVSGLPRSVRKKSDRSVAVTDKFISSLKVLTIIYAMQKTNPDKLVSHIADDLWKKLYSDPTRGSLVTDTFVEFTDDPQFWDPYFAFRIDTTYKYIHTTGGI